VRAVVQRVTEARVTVGNEIIGAIDRPGLLILVGVTHTDTPAEAGALATKIHTLRILDNEQSAADVAAPLLVVSQFTLYADTRKGRRPSWNNAARAQTAEPLVQAFVDELRSRGAAVATGRFGAHMRVELVNDGPVTLVIDIDAPARRPAPRGTADVWQTPVNTSMGSSRPTSRRPNRLTPAPNA
jgi:D-tyrosyl-tRNA(Tyr) deacylase